MQRPRSGLMQLRTHSRSKPTYLGSIYRQQALLQLKIGFVTGDAAALRSRGLCFAILVLFLAENSGNESKKN